MIRAWLAALLLIWPLAGAAQDMTGLDTTPKSLFFAGRCLAPVLLREPVNTKDLREMPTTFAAAHLYGKDGKVWHGTSDDIVLVELAEGASCGINVFDEDLETVETFMTYWLERDDSPFDESTVETLESGDVRISYDGFCETCGFRVHARALWVREAQFTIYRVYATLPEKV
ncbi:MAG: hypothetical protein AAFY52_09790 [Pseudomonadota bacterium]